MKHATTKNERDRLLIEALIWRFGLLSRARIHELTNLQRSDITRSVRELVKAGRLVQAGRADNPVGRQRVLLRLNEKHGFVVGVGFDDENVLTATMDLHLRVRSLASRPNWTVE